MTSDEKTTEGLQMSFWEHVGELRGRLFKALGAIVLGFVVAYTFSDSLFRILMVPFNNAYQNVFGETPKLITTGLLESFLVYLKVGLLGGVLLATPAIFYQIWAFVTPGLHVHERRHVVPVVTLATLFFVGGACFGYFVVFPLGFSYFLSLAPSDYVQPMIRMQEYFQISAWMMIVFGLVFEVPMVVLYLAFLGIIQPKHLVSPWRAILVGIAVASALLTPADPGSMILMSIPMIGLYGLTIIFSYLVSRKRKKA